MFWEKKKKVPRPQWKMEKDLGRCGICWVFYQWSEVYRFYRYEALTTSEREAKIYCEHVGIPWDAPLQDGGAA